MNNDTNNILTNALIELMTELRDRDASTFTDSTHDDYINDLADLLDPTPFDHDDDNAYDDACMIAHRICSIIRPDLFND